MATAVTSAMSMRSATAAATTAIAVPPIRPQYLPPVVEPRPVLILPPPGQSMSPRAVTAKRPQYFLPVVHSSTAVLTLPLVAVNLPVVVVPGLSSPPGWHHGSALSSQYHVPEELVPLVPVDEILLFSAGNRSNITQDIADRKTL